MAAACRRRVLFRTLQESSENHTTCGVCSGGYCERRGSDGARVVKLVRRSSGAIFDVAVDKAESEPELALAVNGGAPRAFAEALRESGGRLLQVSTGFVFNGQQGSPYRPEQARDPLGVYGASKAAGEEAVEQLLGVVADQVGCPTSTATLAAACWRAIAVMNTPWNDRRWHERPWHERPWHGHAGSFR